MSFLCSLIKFWNVSFWFFSFSQLYIEMTKQNISIEQNFTFFPLSLSAHDIFQNFSLQLGIRQFSSISKFPIQPHWRMHLINPSEFYPAPQGCPGWLLNKSKPSAVPLCRKAMRPNPAQPTRAEHSTHSSVCLFSFISQTMWTHFGGGHGSAHALYPAVTMSRKHLVRGQARIVISVFRGRGGSFGFNHLKKMFLQGFFFSPLYPWGFFLIFFFLNQSNLRGYSQEHHTQWRSWNNFFWHR